MEDQKVEREIEFAVGFVGGRWREVEVTVLEDSNRVMDDEELEEEALKLIGKMDFSEPVAFYHVLHIGDPEGGYAED